MPRIPKAPLPGQLLVKGRKTANGPVLEWQVGEHVTAKQLACVKRYLLEPFYSILVALRGEDPYPSLQDELVARGADLSTFRLSIFVKGYQPTISATISRIVPGRLKLAYGRVPHSGPDMCCTWSVPFSRRESSLVLSRITMGRFPYKGTSSKLALANTHASAYTTLPDELAAVGLDYHSLHWFVKHRDLA